MINADKVLDVDKTLIPTGKINSVTDTPLDFTQPKKIGQDIAELKKDNPGFGYDHCYVLNKRPTRDFAPQLAARATSPKSGITMEVSTTEPGVQLYSANHLDGKSAAAGAPTARRLLPRDAALPRLAQPSRLSHHHAQARRNLPPDHRPQIQRGEVKSTKYEG